MTITAIGVLGMSLILLAFLMNQMNKWKNNNVLYDTTNLIGSSIMIYYALSLKSVPFVVLNVVWALFSLKDVFIYYLNKTK